MPTLLWQRRRSYAERAAAIEHEINQARAERRRPRRVRAIEAPQSRSFLDDAALRAFAAALKARHPDIALSVSPDRPTPPHPSQGRLDEVPDELWSAQPRTGSNTR